MVTQINAIHFEITERLTSFINKKIDRVLRKYDWITGADVSLRVVKPETSLNKEAQILFTAPGSPDLVAKKVCDTFEEAVDQCLDALDRQLERYKEKNEPKD